MKKSFPWFLVVVGLTLATGLARAQGAGPSGRSAPGVGVPAPIATGILFAAAPSAGTGADPENRLSDASASGASNAAKATLAGTLVLLLLQRRYRGHDFIRH